MNTTRWTPDHCARPACIIEYTWDPVVAPASRVHTAATVVRRCVDHAAVATTSALWTALQDESSRKNKFWAALITSIPTAFTTDAGGTSVLTGGRTVTWVWNVSRVMVVTMTGFTGAQKTTATTWVTANYPGLIQIL